MSTVQAPQALSSLQTELLKLYAVSITNNQLLDVKRLLARYFAESAMNAMDAFGEEQQLTDADMDKWLHEEHPQGQEQFFRPSESKANKSLLSC